MHKFIKKALTFRASSIGDALMGKYFLENIHREFPEAACGLLVGSRGKMLSDFFSAYPWLEVWEVNRRNPFSILRAAGRFLGSDFTLIQYSENQFSTLSKLFARLVTKRGSLAGFEDGWRFNKLIYDKVLPFAGEYKSRGLIEEERNALSAFGIPVRIKTFTLNFKKDAGVLAKFKLRPGGYIILHFFSGSDSRGLNFLKKREIAKAIYERFGGNYELVLTGDESEREAAVKVAEGMPIKIAAGKTSMTELVNLVSLSKAVLSLDTGVAHIAGHIQKQLVVLSRCKAFSAWWSPLMYQKNVSVLCNQIACEGVHSGKFPKCLNEIDTDLILSEISKHA